MLEVELVTQHFLESKNNMCGIIGYVGKKTAMPIILEGLRRLEYRGYDSAGIAILDGTCLQIRKGKGKIDEGLAKLLEKEPALGNLGIGHTRWATHGPPSYDNSHPHLDQSGKIALVHNGVIENYDKIKDRLVKAGHKFRSLTDTEVLAHLIGVYYEQLCGEPKSEKSADPEEPLFIQAVKLALKEVIGTYGIAAICSESQGVIVGACLGSPLIIGVNEGEHFLASDANAVVTRTRNAVFLKDHDVVTLTADNFKIENLGSDTANFQISQIEHSAESGERGEFPHYMLKEIFEQPSTIENAMRGRIDFEEAMAHLGGLNMDYAELRLIEKIIIIACGTSWHAALVGEYLFEEFARIPTEVEYASEFRYRNAPIEKNTLILVVTQSGETADTLAGLREAKRRDQKILAICNVVGSTIAREADGGIYLHAGPEIGVASTKAFTSQVTVMILFALLMGRIRTLSFKRGLKILKALDAVPNQIKTILAQNEFIKSIAQKYASVRDFYFLGRLINFPVALEGALKLKEISYIHAEGFPAAEMKHGPIALIDENAPTVMIIPSDGMYEKVLSNLEVVKARSGPIIAIATEGNQKIRESANDVIYIPATLEPVFPLLGILPLQLLAYHIAVARGCDVDKPRNLAKSVTVE